MCLAPFRRSSVFVGLIVVSVAIVGCQKPGLHRTRLDEWRVHEFPLLGIRVDLPVDCQYSADSPEEVGVLMHPVYPPPFQIAEPRYILEVRFKRMSVEDFEINQPRNHADEFWNWMYLKHKTVDQIENHGYSVFRLDLDCRDGTVIRILANFERLSGRDKGDSDSADEWAIRRLLSSAECSSRKARKVPQERCQAQRTSVILY